MRVPMNTVRVRGGHREIPVNTVRVLTDTVRVPVDGLLGPEVPGAVKVSVASA